MLYLVSVRVIASLYVVEPESRIRYVQRIGNILLMVPAVYFKVLFTFFLKILCEDNTILWVSKLCSCVSVR